MHHIHVVTRLEDGHLDQLPELIEAATKVDGHEPLGEHKFLRLQHGDDLAVAVVAYEGDRLVGYAHTLTYDEESERRVSCELAVHPEFRRQGVGRTLVTYAIERAKEQGARRLDIWDYNHSPASERFANEFGFSEERRLLHMHRHPSPVPGSSDVPGATLRSFRPGSDDEAWLALNNRIFAGHPENGNWTLEDLRARMAQPWFNADDLLMLEADGGVAGFCWLKVRERPGDGLAGEIYVIGVAPERHGRGYGRLLLRRGLARLAERGTPAAGVYVDAANSKAIDLYERTGFHNHHVDVCYSRAVEAKENSDPGAAVA